MVPAPPVISKQKAAFRRAKRTNECVKAHICPECGKGLTHNTATSSKVEGVTTMIYFTWEVFRCECGFYYKRSLGIK